MHPQRRMVRQALRLGLVVALVVLAVSACGGGGKEQASKPRPLPEDRKDLRPGEYRSEEFNPSLTFRLGKGWKNVPPEAFDVLALTRREPVADFGFLNVQRVYEPSKTGMPIVVHAPKDLLGWVQEHPYLQTSKPEPVTVGGVEGVQFDVGVAKDLPEDYHSGVCHSIADPEDCVDLFRLSTPQLSPVFISAREKVRFIVLKDVKGATVTIVFGSPAIEFDEHASEAQKVLDNVEWRGS
jgi:hypothetical protein